MNRSRAASAIALRWLEKHITTKEYSENLRHTFYAWHRVNATRVPVNNENPVLGQMYNDMTGDWFCHIVNTELITSLRMMLENAPRCDYAWAVTGFGVHVALMCMHSKEVDFTISVLPHRDNNLSWKGKSREYLPPPADLIVGIYDRTLERV